MSKTYGMAGWRIGFVARQRRDRRADQPARTTTPASGSSRRCSTPRSPRSKGRRTSVEERRAAYERRRDRLAAALPEPPVCEGTFYVWLRLPEGLTAGAAARRAPRRASRRARASARAARAGRGSRSRSPTRRSSAGSSGSRRALAGSLRMKIGIVVPFSWSYWGGVVEHAENQAAALRDRGHDVKILMGHDPPGQLTRLLHPRTRPPRRPAGGDHPGRPLGRRPGERLAAEHRPLAAGDPPRCATCSRERAVRPHPPARADDAGDLRRRARRSRSARSSATWHAAGDLGWMRAARCTSGASWSTAIDARIAVSRDGGRVGGALARARASRSSRTASSSPSTPIPADREHHVVFIGRHDARKGLPVLLRAWPEIRRAPARGCG